MHIAFLPLSSWMTCNFLQYCTSLPKLKGNVGGAGAAAAPFRAQLKRAVVHFQGGGKVLVKLVFKALFPSVTSVSYAVEWHGDKITFSLNCLLSVAVTDELCLTDLSGAKESQPGGAGAGGICQVHKGKLSRQAGGSVAAQEVWECCKGGHL